MGRDRNNTRLRAGRWLGLAVLILVIATVGCTAPPMPEGPTVTRFSVADEAEYDRLWQVTEDVLFSYHFRPDRRDRQQGVLSTFAETSPIILEFWRKQPEPAYYGLESNCQTIQRKAEVRFEPTAAPGIFETRVQVDRYRYSLEERQVDNAAAAMRLYSGAVPTLAGRRASPQESGHWIDLGRDAPMEQRILDEIQANYAAPASIPPGTGTQPE